MPTLSDGKPRILRRPTYCEAIECDKCEDGIVRWGPARAPHGEVAALPLPPDAAEEQVYEGKLFRDILHGEGVYRWNNSKIYEGNFYSNLTEGYALLSFPDNSYFEGLFVKNRPFGPGILTHADGCQDAGFWVGRKLARLSSAVDSVVPRLAASPAAQAKIRPFRRLVLLSQEDCDSVADIVKKVARTPDRLFDAYSRAMSDPRSVFFERPTFEESYFAAARSGAPDEAWRACGERDGGCGPGGPWAANEAEADCCARRKYASWNRSDLCADFLKQTYRHRAFSDKVNLKVGKLMSGTRSAFRTAGEKENRCLEFLRTCSTGPTRAVKDILCRLPISEHLADARGNNAIIFAAATDQHDIIDVLADFGADANAFNDEHLTPLNLCLLRRLALANGISDWEAAFLPPERDKPFGSTEDDEDWEFCGSVQSLVKIFGSAASESASDVFELEEIGRKTWEDAKSFADADASENNLRSVRSAAMKNSRSFRFYSEGSVEERISARKEAASKSNKREETGRKTKDEKYLFELVSGGENHRQNKKSESLQKEKQSWKAEEEDVEDLSEKIEKIDGTIQRLLKRGADPNLSEVPRPSVHLAIFTKDVGVVRTLLTYGASPDCQLHRNEGLLTPLHVLALLKPAPEYVDICELLLEFGADPEKETAAGFCISEGERDLLDPSRGRTPLQLLCMRTDEEIDDPLGCLSKMSLALAKVSSKKNYYNGHSYLSLAMFGGNIGILRTLLRSKYFSPNEILGRDLGTALHVLVSTPFQKRTTFDSSIKICDLLIASGANPSKEFKSPPKLAGTCVDFGLREIECERTRRRTGGFEKKETKSGKTNGRDHLGDHVKVVEYLGEIATGGAKTGGRPFRAGKSGEGSADEALRTNRGKNFSAEEKAPRGSGDDEKSTSEKENSTARNANEISKRSEREDLNGPFKKPTGGGSKLNGAHLSKDGQASQNKRSKRTTELGTGRERAARREGASGREGAARGDGGRQKMKHVGWEKWTGKANARESSRKYFRKTNEYERGKKKTAGRSAGPKNPRGRVKRSEGRPAGRADGQRGFGGAKEAPSTCRAAGGPWAPSESPCSKQASRVFSETFPENVRQSLLRMFGSCLYLDIDELLLPYVVLRDGNLYYRFQGKHTGKKEQYSLI